MGNHRISPDIKLAAIRLYEHRLLSLHQILECVGFSRRTFFRILSLFNETGEVAKPRSLALSRPRVFNHEDLNYFLQLVYHRPNWFLDELQELVESNRFISVHFSTIHCKLQHAGISLKKLQKITKERDKDLHADFMWRVAQYAPEEMIWIDETSKDKQTLIRRNGRAKKSHCASMKGVFVRGRWLTAVAALSMDGIVAGHVIEGSLCRANFLSFLEDAVVHFLLLFHVMGSLLCL